MNIVWVQYSLVNIVWGAVSTGGHGGTVFPGGGGGGGALCVWRQEASKVNILGGACLLLGTYMHEQSTNHISLIKQA